MDTILSQLIVYYSNIWIGIVIAILLFLLVVGFVFVLNKKPSGYSYILGILFVPFIAFQISRLYGAIELKDAFLTTIAAANVLGDGIVKTGLLPEKEAIDDIASFASLIPGVSDFTNWITEIIAQGENMVNQVQEYIRYYIIRRCLWLSLFVVLMVASMFLTVDKGSKTSLRRYASGRYDRTNGQERRQYRKRRN